MEHNILVTGAAGFIGSNFVEYFVKKYPSYNIVVLDKLTYAGKIENLENIKEYIKLEQADICNYNDVKKIFKKYNINGVIHFAAESHVDNSIKNPFVFIETNVLGTTTLLEVAKEEWGEGSKNKFVHISTDEVYGSLTDTGYFTEISNIKPNSPYAASKASSDLIALAYCKTYNLNINVTNCSNNYGPYQHEEKLIPHMIKLALEGKKLPIYGNGLNIRDWLYVSDHCKAIDLVYHKGKAGERYNIGGHNEKKNIDIVRGILDYLGQPYDLIEFVEDRKGHDYRYAINAEKIERELGWKPETNFEDGIKHTIDWYVKKYNFEKDKI